MWETAKTVCPAGWHLPSRGEWDDLAAAVGGVIRRQRMPGRNGWTDWTGAGKNLKAKSGWINDDAYCKDSVEDCAGANKYGFSALPGGYRFSRGFHEMGNSSFWWSSADGVDSGGVYNRNIRASSKDLYEMDRCYRYGFSVRCVRDGGKRRKLARWRKEEAKKLRKERERIEKLSSRFTDQRDGRVYRTVKIGGRTWMAENLNYDTPDSSWCYDSDTVSCGEYGRLYDWETALTVCPNGWHLPTRKEWGDLVAFAGGADSAAEKLKVRIGWDDYDKKSSNGTDEYGFSALPGGIRHTGDLFGAQGVSGDWWTATEYGPGKDGGYYNPGWEERKKGASAYLRSMYFVGQTVSDVINEKRDGLSVRCVLNEDSAADEKRRERYEQVKAESRRKAELARRKIARRQNDDERTRMAEERRLESVSEYLTDPRDGQRYRTVEIGSAKWTARNMNYRVDSSWCYGNDTTNCGRYGRLYKWNEAKTVCPAGWHLPSRAEWDSLARAVKGETVYGEVNWYTADKKLKASLGWVDYRGDRRGNGSDEYRFSALPGGIRYANGAFKNVGETGFWWSSAETDGNFAGFHSMDSEDEWCGSRMEDINKGNGLSVRCVEDARRSGD